MTTKTELLNNGVVVATKTAAPFYSWDWTPATSGASSLTYKRYEDGVLVFTSGALTGTVEAAAAGLVLDGIPNLIQGLSVRKLRTDYAGAPVEAIRISDSVVQDISFDGGNLLDTTALTTFRNVTGGDVKLNTWYDQTLNGNDATTPLVNDRPDLWGSGGIEYLNSIVTISRDLTANNMETAISGETIISAFFVVNDAGTRRAILAGGQGSAEGLGVSSTDSSDDVAALGGVIQVDGVTVNTRGEFKTALNDLLPHVVSAVGVDITGWTTYNMRYFSDALSMMRRSSERILISGAVSDIVRDQIVANQTAYYKS